MVDDYEPSFDYPSYYTPYHPEKRRRKLRYEGDVLDNSRERRPF